MASFGGMLLRTAVRNSAISVFGRSHLLKADTRNSLLHVQKSFGHLRTFSHLCTRSRGSLVQSCPSRRLTHSEESLASTPMTKGEVMDDFGAKERDDAVRDAVIGKVNEQIACRSHGRLFCVVHVTGKQFKITPEDTIVLQTHVEADVGERIRLEKVLLVGGRDFTLVGRPLLPRDLVAVHATVIEKTLGHTVTIFRKKRRKQYKNRNFHREALTMLRINAIDFLAKVDEASQHPHDVTGVTYTYKYARQRDTTQR